MNKVFCFGEILLRMSPELNRQWIQENKMPVYIGGAELNVATALARWQVPAMYCSAMPNNYLSQEMDEFIKQKSIDTSAMHYGGERIGIYYLPQGADMKNAGVIYDRAYSSFASLQPGTINWQEVLKDANWFHFSAISPALTQNVVDVCEEALIAASQMGITISVDLNHRAKLWKYGKDPVDVMPALVKYCDLVMGNVWAANTLLGIDVNEKIHENASMESYLAHGQRSAENIIEKFPKVSHVANTFRFDYNQKGIRYFTALYAKGDKQYASPEFIADEIVDKVGSGDCFMAGLIYGLYHNKPAQQVIDFAASAAYGKLHEKGDVTDQSIEAIEERLAKMKR